MLETAQNLLRKQDFSSAMTAFMKIIKDEPNNARAHAGLASSLYGLKLYSDARFAAEQAQEIDASLAEPYITLAYIHIIQKDSPEISYQLAERAYKLDPDSLIAMKGLGLTSILSGKYEQGLRLLEQVYESRKDDSQVQELIIRGYFKQRKYLAVYQASKKFFDHHRSFVNGYDMAYYFLLAHPGWGVLFGLSLMLSLLIGLFHPLFLIYPMVVWLLGTIKRTIVFVNSKNLINGFYLVFGYLVLSGFIWLLLSTK